MKGTGAIAAVVVVGGLVFGLFQVKLAVQDLEQRLARLDRALLESETNIHVLRAEWAYLNRPERLAKLAARYLDLAPLRADQIAAIGRAPARRPIVAAVAAARASAPLREARP